MNRILYVAACLLFANITIASGPEIVISLETSELLPAEPLVVRLSYATLDYEGLPADIGGVRKRGTHHFIGRVLEGDIKVGDVYLGAGGLTQDLLDGPAHATLLGVIGTLTPLDRDSVFAFFTRPGKYRMEIQEQESGAQSNSVYFSIISGNHREIEAGKIAASGGKDVFLALLNGNASSTALGILHDVETRFQDTLFADYAGAILDQRALELISKNMEGSAAERCPAVQHIAEITRKRFFAGHPLRSRILVAVARTGETCPALTGKNDPLVQLIAESDDGFFQDTARAIRSSMARK